MDLDEPNTVCAQAQTIYPQFTAPLVPSESEPDRDAGYVVTLAPPDGFTMTIHTLQVWLNHMRDMVRPTVRVVAQSSGQVSSADPQPDRLTWEVVPENSTPQWLEARGRSWVSTSFGGPQSSSATG
jgi:hypothetical protein